MQRATVIAAGISFVVIAGLAAVAAPAVVTAAGTLSAWALSGPAPAEPSPSAQPDDADRPQPEDAVEPGASGLISVGNGTSFSAEGPGDCVTNAAIHPYGAHDPAARLGGELTDMGVSAFASGEVGYTAGGLIETYTVEAGDTLIGIGQRFCVDYVTVGGYNDVFIGTQIQPGDVLILRP